jgi:hypothetical protein
MLTMDKHRNEMTFSNTDENQSKCCVSESRMPQLGLSGLDGGLLKFHFSGMEGGLP